MVCVVEPEGTAKVTCLKTLLLLCLTGFVLGIAHAGDTDFSCRAGDFSVESATFAEAQAIGAGRCIFFPIAMAVPAR